METNLEITVEFLSNELLRRKGKNRYYSLRSFSRDLGISPSYLSKILSHRVPMTEKLKIKIIKSLEAHKLAPNPADEIMIT